MNALKLTYINIFINLLNYGSCSDWNRNYITVQFVHQSYEQYRQSHDSRKKSYTHTYYDILTWNEILSLTCIYGCTECVANFYTTLYFTIIVLRFIYQSQLQLYCSTSLEYKEHPSIYAVVDTLFWLSWNKGINLILTSKCLDFRKGM